MELVKENEALLGASKAQTMWKGQEYWEGIQKNHHIDAVTEQFIIFADDESDDSDND